MTDLPGLLDREPSSAKLYQAPERSLLSFLFYFDGTGEGFPPLLWRILYSESVKESMANYAQFFVGQVFGPFTVEVTQVKDGLFRKLELIMFASEASCVYLFKKGEILIQIIEVFDPIRSMCLELQFSRRRWRWVSAATIASDRYV